MAFMQPEIYQGDYYEVETNCGTFIVPADVCGTPETFADLSDYVEGEIYEPDDVPEMKNGWLARMQAPGYLDSTDWGAYSSEQEAREELAEMYGDEEDENDDTSDES